MSSEVYTGSKVSSATTQDGELGVVMPPSTFKQVRGHLMSETITWIDTADRLPDDCLNVLIAIPTEGIHDVWLGYHDDGEWYGADGMNVTPSHWAEMPMGPNGGAACA